MAAAALAAVTASAQFASDPGVNTDITPDVPTTYTYELGAAPDGSVIYMNYWGGTEELDDATDGNGVTLNTATYLQIFDSKGNRTLDAAGMVVSDERTRSYCVVNQMLLADREGNALIAVSDARNGSGLQQGSQLTYTLYKVSPTGEMLWGEDGVELEGEPENADLEAKMNMIQIDNGNYVVAWMKCDAQGSSPFNIYMMYLDKETGEKLWDEPMVIEPSESGNYIMYPWLVDAGANEFILIYTDGQTQQMYAQRYDITGEATWSDRVQISDGYGLSTDIPLWTYLKVCSDGNGGAFLAWWADPDFDSHPEAYAAHVTSEGRLGFGASFEDPVALSLFNVTDERLRHEDRDVAIAAGPDGSLIAVFRSAEADNTEYLKM